MFKKDELAMTNVIEDDTKTPMTHLSLAAAHLHSPHTHILQSSVSSMHYLGKKFGQTMYVATFFTLLLFLEGAIFVLI